MKPEGADQTNCDKLKKLFLGVHIVDTGSSLLIESVVKAFATCTEQNPRKSIFSTGGILGERNILWELIASKYPLSKETANAIRQEKAKKARNYELLSKAFLNDKARIEKEFDLQ